MDWEEFKDLIHESWHEKLKPFIESKDCDVIYKRLKKDSKRGKKIAPLSENVWRCFKETPFDKLKLVMIGMSPYHTFRRNTPIADGLLMGCSVTGQLQPSLELFYDALERDYNNGLNLHMVKDPDVSYLARQGVLMLNVALTVEANKPGSHTKLWEPFMKYLFEEVLDKTGVPVVFLGNEAAKCRRYITPFTWQIKVSHPASAAYKYTDWNSENVFKNVNTILRGNNQTEINWIKSYNP
jgi:uracil-DNA glycosylase